MQEKFQRIWNLALPYQDKRNDQGHAAIVTSYAKFLTEHIPKVREEITIPAAILHDIGWSQIQKTSEAIARPDLAKEITRIKHQVEGMILAERILMEVNYSPTHTRKILDIILEHDIKITEEKLKGAGYSTATTTKVLSFVTKPDSEGFKSANEGVVRDADKLWRYCHIGFWEDVRRRGLANQNELLVQANLIEKDMEQKNFMYSKIAKRLATGELKTRKREIANFHQRHKS